MTKPVIYIVIYSLYHHVYKLSLSIKEGLESKGVEVQLFQVQETLSDDILTKMQAPPKPDVPVISIDKLIEPDGILFGFPTRFGTMPAQMKALLDTSGALWAKGALAGKFAGAFFSTASQHGGQETTALTAVTYFSHHGMMYVPFGFANNNLYNLDEVVGGSAYGCGTVSDGDGSRQPTGLELDIAKNQGKNFADIVTTFVKGRDLATGNETTDATTSADSGTNATGDDNTTDPTKTTTAEGENKSAAIPVASAAVAGDAASAAAGTTLATGSTDTAPTTITTTDGTTTTTEGGVTGKTTEIGATAGALAAGTTAASADVVSAIGTKDKDADTGVDTTNATTTTTDKPATDIGAAVASTSADNAATTSKPPNAVKESLVNKSKESKPNKKKWFCCG